jgi:hypothetical protein
VRILSLGFPLPGPAIDNHSFASAPSFFDYDALIVEPLALSRLIEDVAEGRAEHRTRGGERVVNGSSGPDGVGLADLLRDRRDETARLLARGGLAVCFAAPNAVHANVAGFSGCDRYCWLPAPAGLAYREPFLRRGAGSALLPIEHDHPFGAFVDELRGKLAYRAYIDENAPGAVGAARVFGRSAGGAAVAVEIAVEGGRVVLLPAPAREPAGDQAYSFSSALQEGIRRALRLASGSTAPDWVAGIDLPGLRERLETRQEAAQGLLEAQERLGAADEALDDLTRWRALLWQQGVAGFEEPVRAALALLGFRVIAKDTESPAQLQLDRGHGAIESALLETDAGEGEVGMAGHYRLRRRLEEAIEQGRPKRGLLIINGHRRRPPGERSRQYSEALRIAAESLRYCVATGEQLFHAIRAQLAGDEATVATFRDRLLTTEGVLKED